MKLNPMEERARACGAGEVYMWGVGVAVGMVVGWCGGRCGGRGVWWHGAR